MINRREFLTAAACVGSLPRTVCASASSRSTIEVLLNEPLGAISPLPGGIRQLLDFEPEGRVKARCG